MKPSIILAIALATLSSLQISMAAPIQAQFTAIVTSTSHTAGIPPIGAGIQGVITFDYDPSSYSLANDCGPFCTSYFYSTSPHHFTVNLGSSVISTPYTGLAVSDNTTFLDPLAPAKDAIDFATKSQGTGYTLVLNGPSSSFSGTAIPSLAVLTALGQEGYFYITSPTFDNLLTARVNSFFISSVPEPSVALLLAFGIATLLGMKSLSRRVAEPKNYMVPFTA